MLNSQETQLAYFAAGCFWCVEAIFTRIKGVIQVESGYMGGHVAHPTYEQVCSKDTGHAELVKISFDDQTVSYAKLLDVFFMMHDPTTKDRQGNDVGPQYRSEIFFINDQQKKLALAAIKKNAALFERPIVTKVSPASEFYLAETYHQDFYNINRNHPYCSFVIEKKLRDLNLV